ncbi:MAG: hypothetical protein V1806_07440 [Pseudomonadota bacterium]
MPIRALFTECNDAMWVEIAARLAALQNWQPVYWVGLPAQEPLVANSWPQAVFHSKIAAIKGLPAPACAGLASVRPDQELLTELAACEGLTLRMLDRMDPLETFTYRQRLDLYQRYLGYWLAVLERFQPQVVFFPIAPHMGYDYLLYELCQRRGIATVMLEQVIINSRLFAISRYEDQDTAVSREYQRLLAQEQGGDIPLPPDIEEHLAALKREYQVPFYVARMNKKSGEEPEGLASAWLWCKSQPMRLKGQLERVGRILCTPTPDNYMKPKGRRFQDRPLSHREFEYYRWLGRRQRRRLRAQYQALASPPDLGQPYVYLPLHYQPEMSTLPLGGLYEDQRVLAGLISSFLPAGWRLYVKEHPVQVSELGRGQQSRLYGYYESLLELPNVSLVPLEHSSYDLIDHCQATATITGQAGWEAVNRGKPALTFGSAWYRGCEGVWYAPTRQALQEVLARIMGGYQVDQRKVRLFAQAVDRSAVAGYVEPIFAKQYGISQEENVAAIVRLVTECLGTC